MTETPKKKKKPKKRTQNKFENGVLSCIRRSFSMNSPTYEQVMQAGRVEKDVYKKNGELSKKKEVWYSCILCENLVKDKDIRIDHIIPVIEIGKTRKDYTWDEIINRIDCDISNLQRLCTKCHDEKTADEKKRRSKK